MKKFILYVGLIILLLGIGSLLYSQNTSQEFSGPSGQFLLYNVTGANYGRGFIRWDSNIFKIGTEIGGSGTNRSIGFYPATGQVFFPDASAATPSISFYNDSGLGFYRSASGHIGFSAGTTLSMIFGGNGNLQLVSNSPEFSMGVTAGAPDLILTRDGANTLAMKNGVNAQIFRTYNTDDGAGNYERGYFKWDSSILKIGTEKGGSGTLRDIQLEPGADLILNPTGYIKIMKDSSGGGTSLLGTNSPATTLSAPYTWIKVKSSDGTIVYIPAWK